MTVALVSPAGPTRSALAAYLRRSGFDVQECDELTVASSFGALVVVADHMTADGVVGKVGAWIELVKPQRVVIVTPKPTMLKALVALHGHRLHVLPAPAFGWDLVDALREVESPGPRSS